MGATASGARLRLPPGAQAGVAAMKPRERPTLPRRHQETGRERSRSAVWKAEAALVVAVLVEAAPVAVFVRVGAAPVAGFVQVVVVALVEAAAAPVEVVALVEAAVAPVAAEAE